MSRAVGRPGSANGDAQVAGAAGADGLGLLDEIEPGETEEGGSSGRAQQRHDLPDRPTDRPTDRPAAVGAGELTERLLVGRAVRVCVVPQQAADVLGADSDLTRGLLPYDCPRLSRARRGHSRAGPVLIDEFQDVLTDGEPARGAGVSATEARPPRRPGPPVPCTTPRPSIHLAVPALAVSVTVGLSTGAPTPLLRLCRTVGAR